MRLENVKQIKNQQGYKYSGRQEITHKLSPGFTIFEANIQPDGAPQYRSHFFQIHDGRSSGKPPSMVQVNKYWAIGNQHSTDCFKPKCEQLSYGAFKAKRIRNLGQKLSTIIKKNLYQLNIF